jgi:hypothetical protein
MIELDDLELLGYQRYNLNALGNCDLRIYYSYKGINKLYYAKVQNTPFGYPYIIDNKRRYHKLEFIIDKLEKYRLDQITPLEKDQVVTNYGILSRSDYEANKDHVELVEPAIKACLCGRENS